MTISQTSERIKQVSRTLIGVNLVLSLVLALALTTKAFHLGHDVEASAVTQYSPRSATALMPIDEATVSRVILGRAPFRTMRRVEDKLVDELGRFELKGISSGKNGAKAFVKDTKRKRTITVRVGDTLGNRYEVIAIDSKGLTVRRGNDEITLKR